MASTLFLEISADGTALEWEGEHSSTMADHAPAGSHPIVSYDWGATRMVSPGGQLTGDPEGHQLVITWQYGKQSPIIFDCLHTGKIIEATVTVITADPNTSNYETVMKITVKRGRIAMITNACASGGDTIHETFAIGYGDASFENPKFSTVSEMSVATIG